jgi:hypothetical membrane protein
VPDVDGARTDHRRGTGPRGPAAVAAGRGSVAATVGVLGPALFTVAWAVGGERQRGYSPLRDHISGLAAADAHDPWIMVAGFVALGVAALVVGVVLERALGGRAAAGRGPRLVAVAGACAVLAGAFRRDTLVLQRPEVADPSAEHIVHDLVSFVLYVAMVVAPLVLARRFAREARWAAVAPLARAAGWWAGALVLLFASRAAVEWNGVWQRAATLGPLLLLVVVAVRLRREPCAEPVVAQSVDGNSSDAHRTTMGSGRRVQSSSFAP